MWGIDKSTYVNGRIDNRSNPNIVAIWNSDIPAACFFVTIFNISLEEVVEDEEIVKIIPDLSLIITGFCKQEVEHVHMVLCMLNEYEKYVILDRLYSIYGNSKIYLSPIYKGINPCAHYIYNQCVIIDDFRYFKCNAILNIEDMWMMNGIGNVWWRVLADNITIGVSCKMLVNWCTCGYPPYAYNHVRRWTMNAVKCGFLKFYKNLTVNKMRRCYYNERVLFKLINLSNASCAYNEICDILMSYFGQSKAATPFIYDMRGILCGFSATAFPNYTCQPGIFLYTCDNFLNELPQRDTISSILNRKGLYANVEVLFVICENIPADFS